MEVEEDSEEKKEEEEVESERTEKTPPPRKKKKVTLKEAEEVAKYVADFGKTNMNEESVSEQVTFRFGGIAVCGCCWCSETLRELA